MAETFDGDAIAQSNEIFCVLATNPDHMLSRDRYQELYWAYITDTTVQELTNRQAATWRCTIVTVQGNPAAQGPANRDGLCLVPDALDTVLGFTPATLRDRIFRNGGKNDVTDYYLQMFIIMTLIEMFYDGSGMRPRTRTLATTMTLIGEVEKQLQIGADREESGSEGHEGILYSDINARFSGLKSIHGDRTKSTKQGVIANVLLFLQAQGLVDYAQADDVFSPTAKMDAIMEQVVLTDRYYRDFSRYFTTGDTGDANDAAASMESNDIQEDTDAANQ